METSKNMLRWIGAAALVVAAGSSGAQNWNHVPSGDPIGTDNWGAIAFKFATCGAKVNGGPFVEVGKKQSPVNIVTGDTVTAALPPLRFNYARTPAIVENTGHVVEVPYEAGGRLKIGSDTQDAFDLLQFHFHSPSEHTINGQLADAEVHLVHRNNLNDLAVVGVLIKVGYGKQINATADRVLRAEFTHGHHEVDLGGLIDAEKLLPVHKGYFHYSGSLTTPPCSEGVRWFVMKEPIFVSGEAITNLRNTISHFPNYNHFNQNNRPVMPLNGRAVLSRMGGGD
jgi:carbonic anhydrase